MKKPKSESAPLAPNTVLKSTDELDPWWINSPDNDNSFWKWVKKRSYPDGHMDPLMQNEIAELLGCSSTKVHFILKEAMEKLRKSKHLHILADFHGGGSILKGPEASEVTDLLPSPSDSEDDQF